MKWIKKITEYTSYVSKCAHAIAEASKALADNWPTDNPFKRGPMAPAEKEKGMAVHNQK